MVLRNRFFIANQIRSYSNRLCNPNTVNESKPTGTFGGNGMNALENKEVKDGFSAVSRL